MATDAQRADIANRFGFHRGSDPDAASKHATVREIFERHALWVVDLVPPSREQSLALTALEEAAHWAHAGIARMTADGDRKAPETHDQAVIPSVPASPVYPPYRGGEG